MYLDAIVLFAPEFEHKKLSKLHVFLPRNPGLSYLLGALCVWLLLFFTIFPVHKDLFLPIKYRCVPYARHASDFTNSTPDI